MQPSETFLDFIRSGDSFVVAGHKEPDGDCIGSQVALASVLRRMGKKVLLCSAGPFKRSEIIPHEHLFSKVHTEPGSYRCIVVDCSAPDRLGDDLEASLKGLPVAVVDHHTMGGYADEKLYPLLPRFIDINAPSTTYLIYMLIKALGMEPSKEEAELLFLGLCTDTGFFRHIDGGKPGAFEAAAALIALGASPKGAHDAMYGGKSLGSRQLMGHILSKAESHYDGRLIVSTETLEETERYGLENRDSDTLYQLFSSIAGVQAIVVIRQESPDNCTIGFRSRDTVDVRSIAASFGGGGHYNASGCSIKGRIGELKPQVIQAFEASFTK